MSRISRSQWFHHLFAHSTKLTRKRINLNQALKVERLEDRTVPAVIDLFGTAQALDVNGHGLPTSSASSSVTGADMIGGHRFISLLNVQPYVLASQHTKITADPSATPELDYATDTSDGQLHIAWDGTGTSTLNPTGLGGANLTAGGADAFRMHFLLEDLSGNVLTFTVHTDATHFSKATVNLPGGIFPGTPSSPRDRGRTC